MRVPFATENPLGVLPQPHKLLLAAEPLPDDPICTGGVLLAPDADPEVEPEA